MTPDVLRVVIAVLAMLVVGAAGVLAVRYLAAAWRLGRAPGRILARHVVEVAAGASGLALGYAAAVVEQLGVPVWLTAVPRLWLYLASMVLLLTGIAEVSIYQRARAQNYPHRQEQVRAAIRAALEGRPVTGPKSADNVAVHAANAVLALEGTPQLPEPTKVNGGPARSPTPDDYGRHARNKRSGIDDE